MSRARVIDASSMARNMRETFAARDVEYEERLPFTWPTTLQNIGDSLAVAYRSDKWKAKAWGGKRDAEDYKHIAESRNRVLARPGLLRDYYNPSRAWPVIGPTVSLADLPMPRHFAVIGPFIEAQLELHVAGDDSSPEFGADDDGILKLTLAHAHLGASKILWSLESGRRDQPFLFVYDKQGVRLVIVGDELDIERDGIVG